MSEPSTEALPPDDDEALKRRLLNRIAVAGVVVVALLGGLAVFDALYVSPPPAKPEVASAPEPAEPKVAKDEPPAEPKADEPKVDTAAVQEPAKDAPVAEPERTATSAPSAPLRPLTPPATARQAMIKPSEPMTAAKPAPAPAPGREAVRPPPTAATPLSRPLSRAVAASRQYVLQVGVFSNVANAEELRAKLELHGIPSQIEARVQVGPFKTREEAASAREKLRSLGMDEGILTAIRR